MQKKICLSIEQMQRLKELGVETKDASMVLMFFTDNGEELRWEQVENHGKDKPLWEWYNEDTETWEPTLEELFDAETGNYDHSYREECGVFTLQDMLDKLPKRFQFKMDGNCGRYCDLEAHKLFSGWNIMYTELGYDVVHLIESESLLDAAFDMLVWLAKEGYLKGGCK